MSAVGEVASRENIDYYWLQSNVVNLEFVPYHSQKADGLAINNLDKYKKTYFYILKKMIIHLNPKKPIIIFGSSYLNYFKGKFDDDFQIKEELTKYGKFYSGTIFGFRFIGLNFRFSNENLKYIKEIY